MTKQKDEILEMLADPEMRVVWEEERVLNRFALAIEKALRAKKLTKADLARISGKQPQAISRALGGAQNLGVRTMLELAVPLGMTIDVTVSPLAEIRSSVPVPVSVPIRFRTSVAPSNLYRMVGNLNLVGADCVQ